ncbi:hypothetical protein [Actinomadura rupiterrae]|uniref:hypothetical protein n=1 Tax=Actinomadura rupiterrae TaxID=559627 RepID=UPI0020A2460D|nr:hypothetical protein [Actinomadura rupiterrae]MCP2343123.1 hypothetical protein [Actinomadura rupiterrae]
MTSFASDIRPLFREKDVESMSQSFDLSDYDDVSDNAQAILAALADGKMPCDGPWPKSKVDLFRQWVNEGQPR